MIGVLVVTHGTIGEALLSSAAQILGERPEQLEVLGVSRSADPEAVLRRARDALGRLERGDGVLVLADIFGATPANIVGRLLADGKVEGVSGVSLPMLLRVLSGRNGSLRGGVERALSGGAEGVLHMNQDACRNA